MKRLLTSWKPRTGLLPIVFVVIIGLWTGFILASRPAEAAPGDNGKIGFSISPPIIEFSANPGDRITHSIRADNLTDAPLKVVLDRKAFVPVGEDGQAKLTDTQTAYSLASWISLPESEIEIPKGGSKTIDFTINVPVDAEPGGHFGSVVFRTVPSTQDSSGVAVGQEIGSLLLLKVAGKVKEQASITKFTATQGIWEKGPVAFETHIKNDGNVQLKPRGTVTISTIFGSKVDTAPIDSRIVLPGSSRKLKTSWRGSSWPGLYTATVAVDYGDKGSIITSTTRFVIFPYKTIVPILVVVLLVTIYVLRARRRLLRALRILAGRER